MCHFQHIGLPMFSPTRRPKRIYQMTHGVLNLPRNPVLDWTFGHSLISCHVEHHLFPFLSDNMCLKVGNGVFFAYVVDTIECFLVESAVIVLLPTLLESSCPSVHVENCPCVFVPPTLQVKPVVSKYLTEKQLPYQEDSYVSRLSLFFHRYQELMVFAPPITELVGVQ